MRSIRVTDRGNIVDTQWCTFYEAAFTLHSSCHKKRSFCGCHSIPVCQKHHTGRHAASKKPHKLAHLVWAEEIIRFQGPATMTVQRPLAQISSASNCCVRLSVFSKTRRTFEEDKKMMHPVVYALYTQPASIVHFRWIFYASARHWWIQEFCTARQATGERVICFRGYRKRSTPATWYPSVWGT